MKPDADSAPLAPHNREEPLSLPEFAAWAKGFQPPLTWMNFVTLHTSIDLAYGLAHVFWPRFLRVRGCVLLPWAYNEESFDEWWARLDGRVEDIETTLNHTHLWDLFSTQHAQEQAVETAYHEVGSRIASAWKRCLEEQVPEIRFDVELNEREDEYGPTLSVRRQ